MATPYDSCFVQASKNYKVPKEVLVAIASIESRYNRKAINYNKNGTYDIGVMQINSIWFPRLEKMGIQRENLTDGCQNIMVGSWILAQNIRKYGFTWKSIQRYNGSDTQFKYAQKVYAAIKIHYPELSNSKEVVFSSDANNVPKIVINQKIHFLYVK
ncbi:MAG: lytic transglycosylase domain-containing protein [Neisseriaceae bacterium]